MINEAVTDRLAARGTTSCRRTTGPAPSRGFAEHEPDLVVLDVMLPGFDGHEVCRRIQAERPVPVLMLTARDDETDILVGLGVGADDYLTKPFRMRELVARVAALLRRVDRAAELAGAVAPSDLGDLADRRRRPPGLGRRRRGAPDADRVRPAGLPRRRARHRAHPRAAAGRGLGLARRVRHPHRRQPRQGAARQDRRRPGPHRARRRLRPRGRRGPRSCASSTGSRSIKVKLGLLVVASVARRRGRRRRSARPGECPSG